MTSKIQLYQGDCLEVMKNIPDKSVDLVLTDPPYGTTACKWDSVIPLEPMWEQIKRITKPSAVIALFGLLREKLSGHLTDKIYLIKDLSLFAVLIKDSILHRNP